MKILILKPSSLGDVIHALPVLRLLKLHFRDAEIFWWIDSALAPLLEGDPDLAGLIFFEDPTESGTRRQSSANEMMSWPAAITTCCLPPIE